MCVVVVVLCLQLTCTHINLISDRIHPTGKDPGVCPAVVNGGNARDSDLNGVTAKPPTNNKGKKQPH